MCKELGLDRHDMEDMTVGMCFDYLNEAVAQKTGTKEQSVRQASQKDYDNF